MASSFMTPLESRNGTNRNGVRMFGSEKLNKTVASENWDRVKIVCTQPFSKVRSSKFKPFFIFILENTVNVPIRKLSAWLMTKI